MKKFEHTIAQVLDESTFTMERFAAVIFFKASEL